MAIDPKKTFLYTTKSFGNTEVPRCFWCLVAAGGLAPEVLWAPPAAEEQCLQLEFPTCDTVLCCLTLGCPIEPNRL